MRRMSARASTLEGDGDFSGGEMGGEREERERGREGGKSGGGLTLVGGIRFCDRFVQGVIMRDRECPVDS